MNLRCHDVIILTKENTRGISNGFILFNQKNGKWAIYFKQYLNVDNNDVRIERALPYQNLVLEDAMNAARGTREVMDIFSEKKFSFYGISRHGLVSFCGICLFQW